MAVAHRDACSSVHSFVKRLFSPDTLSRTSPDEAARWQAQVPRQTPTIVRRLLAGLLGFLPYSVAEGIPDVLLAILKVQKGRESLDTARACRHYSQASHATVWCGNPWQGCICALG